MRARLHAMETDIAFDPIPVDALDMDGVMTSPHEVSNFVEQISRHTNPRALGHTWSLVRRSVEHLRAMILHLADLPETSSNMELSSTLAC